MKTLAIIGSMLMLMTSTTYALSADDTLHGTAHAGATYAITHATEVVCTKITSKEHTMACTLVGVVLSNGVNVAYKAHQGFPHDSKRSITSGVIGSAGAVLIISIDY